MAGLASLPRVTLYNMQYSARHPGEGYTAFSVRVTAGSVTMEHVLRAPDRAVRTTLAERLQVSDDHHS